MKKVIIIITSVLALNIFTSFSQTITVEQYVQTYKTLAIREMKRMGVPAAITLAQGILETESGNSDLVKKSNNHFGIKCKSTWTAQGVSHDDDALGECFRIYKDAEGSYRDHSNFLRGNQRYAFLFKLDPRDYRGWAYGLKKAGYATNPRYPEILIKNIEDNNLQQYTLLAVNEVPVFDASKYTDDPEEKVTGNVADATQPDTLQTLQSQSKDQNKINGCKVIYASKGKSLLAIATENNINLAKLLECNDLEKDGLLDKDQVIFLEKKATEGALDFYIVQPNETDYDVAQKNGIRLQNLREYNNLQPNSIISAGMRLKLKDKVQEPIVEKTIESNNSKIHEVQPKESLYSISKSYGVSVARLKELNNLTDENLKIGQQLIISK